MRAPPLRWVLWDVKDTLLKVRLSVGDQYCREAERVGLSLKPVEVDSAFRQVYKSYSIRYPNYGIAQGLNGHTWWTAVVRDTFYLCGVQDTALLQTISHNLYHNFCNAQNWEVFDDSKTVLKACASLGLKLGVVSNFDKRLETILNSCDLVAKPSPRIFEQALQKCGVSAAEIAHVGDHYVKDYLASRSVGIHGFLLDRDNKYEQSDIVPKEHRLSSLEELPLRLQQHLNRR
uniref:Haloacid dehalogenase-like hydrolase domain-containing protein 3 n=1 Tax=Neogobius melanostomus TaxID=47308 RepID=A0A8C6V1T3_9GOBI